MTDVLTTLGWMVGGLLVGALVVAPAVVRGTNWLVARDPAWFRSWMQWVGGKAQHSDGGEA